jgi:hypothetical protein
MDVFLPHADRCDVSLNDSGESHTQHAIYVCVSFAPLRLLICALGAVQSLFDYENKPNKLYHMFIVTFSMFYQKYLSPSFQ